MATLTPLVLLLASLSGADRFTGLESPDPAERRAAALSMSEAPDVATLGELIRAVRREDDDRARRAMMVAMGKIGDRRAIPVLAHLLDASEVEAAWAIGRIRSAREPFDREGPDAEANAAAAAATIRTWWKERLRLGAKGYIPHELLRPPPAQVPGLLADLRSGDERLSLRAAERLNSHQLTSDELRIQAARLARNPRSWAEQALDRPLGTADLPVLWRALTRSRVTVADAGGNTHWSLIPAHLPVLVSLLPEASREWFDEFTGLILWGSRDTDRFRDDVALGCVYALARIEAERTGEPIPGWSVVDTKHPGDGLPEAFVTLARNRVEMKGDTPRERGDRSAFVPSLPWLRRWAREVTPAKKDLPFLLEIARRATDDRDRAWAIRALGRRDDPSVTRILEAHAGKGGAPAAFAAAELARDGRPERLLGLLRTRAEDDVVEMLAFEVLPALARRRWRERIAAPADRDVWGRFFLDPGAESSTERLADWGVRFRSEDRCALAAALPVDRLSLELLAWFLTEVSASPLNGPARAKILTRLRAWEYTDDSRVEPDGIVSLLARIEVRAPEELRSLLHHWVEHREGELRETALGTLEALGDTRFSTAIIDNWPGVHWIGAERLGRVKDPRVEAFLRKTVLEEDPDRRGAAMGALAVFYGLPERAADAFSADVAESVFARARKKLLDRDPVAAALLLAGDEPLTELGATGDPRAVAHLRTHRSDRTHRWEAIAGLVLAGDEDAVLEIEGLIRDGRIWIYYPIQDGRVLSINRSPGWIEDWIDRCDATCCIGFSALETLGELFPTLGVYELDHRPEHRQRIAAWWRRNRNHLAYSRILDGWVPTR